MNCDTERLAQFSLWHLQCTRLCLFAVRTSHSLSPCTKSLYQILIFNKCLILTAIMWLLLLFIFYYCIELAAVSLNGAFSKCATLLAHPTHWLTDCCSMHYIFYASFVCLFICLIFIPFYFVTSICLIKCPKYNLTNKFTSNTQSAIKAKSKKFTLAIIKNKYIIWCELKCCPWSKKKMRFLRTCTYLISTVYISSE